MKPKQLRTTFEKGKAKVSHVTGGEITIDKIDSVGKIKRTIAMFNKADSDVLIKKAGGDSEQKIVAFLGRKGILFDKAMKDSNGSDY